MFTLPVAREENVTLIQDEELTNFPTDKMEVLIRLVAEVYSKLMLLTAASPFYMYF